MKRKVTYEERKEITRRFNKIQNQTCLFNAVQITYLRDPEKYHIYKSLKAVFNCLQPVYKMRKEEFNNTEFNPFNN